MCFALLDLPVPLIDNTLQDSKDIIPMHTNHQHYAYTQIDTLFLGCAYKRINNALSHTAYAKSFFHCFFV